MNSFEGPFRMDFEIRVESADESTRTVQFRLIPDPRRYEWREIDGEEYLYDKFDKTLMSWANLKEFMKQAHGMPLYYQSHRLGNFDEYVESRREAIDNLLAGAGDPSEMGSAASDFLKTLRVDSLSFVILVMDIVGSTVLSTELDRQCYVRIVSTVLHEASRMIVRFNGHVLKYTGDGIIAYFPAPSFNTQHDLAIDCASCLRLLIHTAVNSAIEKLSLPTVEIRFGVEAGEASVVTIGSADAKQQKDIIGSVINLAAKIQGIAAPGEIYLGEMAEQNMHTMWRRLCEPVTAGEDWPYKHPDGSPYRIYRLALKTPV